MLQVAQVAGPTLNQERNDKGWPWTADFLTLLDYIWKE